MASIAAINQIAMRCRYISKHFGKVRKARRVNKASWLPPEGWQDGV